MFNFIEKIVLKLLVKFMGMDCTPVKHQLRSQHMEGKIEIEYIALPFVIVSYPSYVRRVISPVKCYTRF
jgi:hypothetical protein